MSIRIGNNLIAGAVPVDTSLSPGSQHPVANAVVYTAVHSVTLDVQTLSGSVQTLSGSVQTIQGDVQTLSGTVQTINTKIPSDASAQNQLVTASQMGDAIASVEARQLYATAAQGSFATYAALTGASTFYLANGSTATPAKNDVAYVLADETHSGKSAKYVLANASPRTWGFVITFSDTTFTNTQMAAINSGATAEKIALIDTAIQGNQKNVANGVAGLDANGKVATAQLPAMNYAPSSHLTDSGAHSDLFAGKATVHYGTTAPTTGALNDLYINTSTKRQYLCTAVAAGVPTWTEMQYLPLTGGTLTGNLLGTGITLSGQYSNGVSTIPSSTSAYTFTEGVFKHAPTTAPTYTLPAVTATTVTHAVVLYFDCSTVASFAFQDNTGNPITVDTKDVTPAVGETWVIWAEYSALKSTWIVRAMKDTEAAE